MQAHRPSTFTFFIFIAGSHELEKDVVKKKMKSYGKANTESKIVMKKSIIQSGDENIQLYQDDQNSLQEKLQKLNEKQQGLAMR